MSDIGAGVEFLTIDPPGSWVGVQIEYRQLKARRQKPGEMTDLVVGPIRTRRVPQRALDWVATFVMTRWGGLTATGLDGAPIRPRVTIERPSCLSASSSSYSFGVRVRLPCRDNWPQP